MPARRSARRLHRECGAGFGISHFSRVPQYLHRRILPDAPEVCRSVSVTTIGGTETAESRTATSSRANAFHVEFKQSVLTLFPRERRASFLSNGFAGATGTWLSRFARSLDANASLHSFALVFHHAFERRIAAMRTLPRHLGRSAAQTPGDNLSISGLETVSSNGHDAPVASRAIPYRLLNSSARRLSDLCLMDVTASGGLASVCFGHY